MKTYHNFQDVAEPAASLARVLLVCLGAAFASPLLAAAILSPQYAVATVMAALYVYAAVKIMRRLLVEIADAVKELRMMNRRIAEQQRRYYAR